jgi:hypothetical protein
VGDYEQPDKGESFSPSKHPEWLGKLFLFWPESVDTVNFTRPDGTQDPTDMVTCDVAIIDLPDPQEGGRPKFIKGARIGGSALAPQVKKKIGKKVLGRLAQAPGQGAKSGAYFIADFTPADVQLAEQYEAQFPRNAYQSGSGNPPQQGWQGGAQAPPQQSQFAGQWGGAQPAAAGPPAANWGGAAPSPPAQPAAPSGNQWGAQPAAPAAPPWPDGLREFLESRGIQTAGMDEAQARQIAATLN